MEYVVLNNGLELPTIGIGTFMLDSDEAENSVYWALNMGYKLIDTAAIYLNEKAVGRGIVKTYKDRDDIFISTKLWPSDYENSNAIDDALNRLGVDYIDLLFLHQPSGDYISGYKMLEKAYNEGKIKAIGISNFEGKYLDDILENCEIVPQVIQVEAHPYFPQKELIKKLEKNDIKLMSWYPLGHGDRSLIEEPIITELANKYNKTNTQIILRWHIQNGFIVIPGSKNPAHIKSNIDIFDFELTNSDMKKISNLDKNTRYYTSTKEDLDRYVTFKPQYDKED